MIFNGKKNVIHWIRFIEAKLTAKGYKSQLQDVNRLEPTEFNKNSLNLRVEWNNNADKTVGIILMHLNSDLMMLFEHFETLQKLLNKIKEFYPFNIECEIEKFELVFSELTYEGQDPVI